MQLAVEPLQQAEQHRLTMVPATWRGHQQSRLTLAFAARLEHHGAVKQAEKHLLAMASDRRRGHELAVSFCCSLPLRRPGCSWAMGAPPRSNVPATGFDVPGTGVDVPATGFDVPGTGVDVLVRSSSWKTYDPQTDCKRAE